MRRFHGVACVDHGDLTGLLYAQGITRKDFVEG
jgi:hypothetical protein